MPDTPTPAHAPTLSELRQIHADPAELERAAADAIAAHERAVRQIHTEAGDSELTASQQRAWDAHQDRISELERFVSARRAERVAESRARYGSVQIGVQPEPAFGADVRSLAPMEARDAAHRLLENRTATEHLRSDQLDHIDALLRTRTERTDGAWIAKAMLLTENPEYRSAFRRVLTDPHPVLTDGEARALRAFQEFRAMSIGTDTAGGYGVPVLIDPTIILTGQGSLNPFLRISRVETITTDQWKGVSSAGVSWSWDAEATPVSDDSPTLAQPEVPAHKAAGFIPFSLEVGQDYPNFAREMSTLLAEGYDELTAQAFAVGDGSGKPRGIVHRLDANTNVEVSVTTSGSFSGDDINKVWAALPDRAKARATWVMSHDVADKVASFGNGNNLSFVTVDLSQVVQTVRTRPVAFSSYTGAMPTGTATGNILVVGDFSRFLIAQRAGMSVELVPHLFDVTNNRPTGQRGLYAWARVGSDSLDDTAFRLLQQ